jgi:putative peptidoglycan lipid II flippase
LSERSGQLVRAATIVMLAFIASRVLGLVREVVIARQFGTSLELAAYLAAFRVPDLIFQLTAGGALGSAFIPVFAGYLAHGQRVVAWRLASAVFNLLLVVLVVAATGAALLAPQLATLIVPGFDPATQALTARLMRLMLLSPVIFGLSGLIMGVLNSFQHFLLPALAPVVYNLAIIGGALFLAPTMGVYGLAVGVVAGSALHLLIQVPMLLHYGLSYSPTFGLDVPGVREVGRLMGPRILGLAIVQVNFLVNTILASGLGGQALPALNYAWLLMLLPEGIVAQGIATAVFPTFAELVARQSLVELRRTFSAALRTVLYLTVPAATGLILLRVPLVQVLLQRGQFNDASTGAVSFALQFYALGLFAHASIEIVTRAFYALHDTRTPVAVGGAAMTANVLLSLGLIRTPLGFGGLALANSLATVAEMLALMGLMRGRLGAIDGQQIGASLARIGLATALMALAVVWLGRLPEIDGLLWLLGGTGLGGTVYLATTLLLGSQEIKSVGRLVRKGIPAASSK